MSYTYDAGTTTPNYAGLAEYNGIRINDGTFVCTRLGGLVDSAPVRLPVTPLPSDHGAYLGPAFYDSIPISLEGIVQTDTLANMYAAIDQLRGAFHLDSTGLKTLVVNTGGWSTRRQVQAMVSGPIVVNEPSDPTAKMAPFREFLIPMVAPDPLMYDADTLRSITLAVNGGSITLPNNGNTSTPFTLAIPGAGNSASLIDDVTGARITLDSTAIGAGVTVTITTNPAASGGITATDGSGTNWYPHITRMDLLSIIPGTRTFHVTGSGFTGGSTVTVSYRDAWT